LLPHEAHAVVRRKIPGSTGVRQPAWWSRECSAPGAGPSTPPDRMA